MAVYEGARPRTIALPRRPRAVDRPAIGRRRVRVAFRAGRRTNRLGIVLGAIVVAFMLAFFSLAQQVRVSATGMDWGLLAAAGVLTLVPGMLVIWFVRNHIAKGFAMGRV